MIKLLKKSYYKNGVMYLGTDAKSSLGIDVVGLNSNSTKVYFTSYDYTKWYHEVGYAKKLNRVLSKNNTFKYNNTIYNVEGIV